MCLDEERVTCMQNVGAPGNRLPGFKFLDNGLPNHRFHNSTPRLPNPILILRPNIENFVK